MITFSGSVISVVIRLELTIVAFEIGDGELIQACYSSVTEGWALTIRYANCSVHRGWLSRIDDSAFSLNEAEVKNLTVALDSLDCDYRPHTGPSGPDYRFLTYRANSVSRHITWIDGWSDDFQKLKTFDEIWTNLQQLAVRLGYNLD